MPRSTSTERANQCGGCRQPMTDVGTLCWDCIDSRDGFRDLLSRLTSHAIGAEPSRTQLRVVIRPGDAGRGKSTAWDTPHREAANLPRMLREATARQTRFAAEPGVRTSGTTTPGLPVDHMAGTHLDRLHTVIARLAVDTARVTTTRPRQATWGAIARWLDTEIPVIRMQDWAPTHLADLRRVMDSATRHVDRPPTRLYLGPCDQHTPDPCPGEYRATDGDQDAACTACGREVDVKARKRQLLDDAQDRWLTAVEIERLTASLGQRVADSTVDAWGVRGQCRRQRLTVDGPWHYPLADVLARVEAAEAKTRRTA